MRRRQCREARPAGPACHLPNVLSLELPPLTFILRADPLLPPLPGCQRKKAIPISSEDRLGEGDRQRQRRMALPALLPSSVASLEVCFSSVYWTRVAIVERAHASCISILALSENGVRPNPVRHGICDDNVEEKEGK
jgi:hypothetical protein